MGGARSRSLSASGRAGVRSDACPAQGRGRAHIADAAAGCYAASLVVHASPPRRSWIAARSRGVRVEASGRLVLDVCWAPTCLLVQTAGAHWLAVPCWCSFRSRFSGVYGRLAGSPALAFRYCPGPQP